MKKTDARVIMTKKFLKESLVSILKEKELSEITIKEVCDAAQINRATFYSHYKSIMELYREVNVNFMILIYDYIIKAHNANSEEERINCFEELIKFVDKETTLFTFSFTNSKQIEKAHPKFYEVTDEIFGKTSNTSHYYIFREYVINFYLYAGGGIIYTWIERGKKDDPKLVAEILSKLLFTGVSPGSNNKNNFKN